MSAEDRGSGSPFARAAFSRRVAPGWALAGLSALVLAPCWWQSRIQARDLSSHIYNTWLAHLAARGEAPGLRLVSQPTNVLFDLILSGLFQPLGAPMAQRIAVSVAVLVLFWGAFAFVTAVSGRRPWRLAPCLAMLAYGWVFHMGFFNFYLSLGICLWAMALAWRERPARLAAAAFLLAAAFTAHGLPVVWAGGMLAYRLAAARLRPRYRPVLLAGALAALGALRLLLRWLYHAPWSRSGVGDILGFNQVWVFGPEYLLVSLGLICVWAALFVRLFRTRGAVRAALGIPFQIAVLASAAVLALPASIKFPAYAHPFNLITDRLSLPVALAFCALAACAYQSRAITALGVVAASLFFWRTYLDHRAINGFEDRVEAAVRTLPPGRRVVGAVSERMYRTAPLAHVVDRACIGHCFSYANYEPATGQFRLRVAGPNPIVISNHLDSYEMQNGRYRFKPSELPVYAVEPCQVRDFELCVRELKAEQYAGLHYWSR